MPLVKRPLRPEEAEWYASQGYDPSTITAEDFVADSPQNESSAGGSFARGLGSAAIPTMAGAGGAALTLGALGAAPFTGGASLIPLLAALGVGAGAGYVAGEVQDELMPEEWKAQLAKDVELHPYASRAGQISALPLGGFNPGKDVLKAGGYGISRLLGNPVTKEGADAAFNTALGSGLGLVQEGAIQGVQGDFDAGRLAEGALLGSVFTKRNVLGEKLYKFPAPVERAVDAGNPEFSRGKKTVVSPETEKVAPKPVAPPQGPVIPPGAGIQPELNMGGLLAQPELALQTPATTPTPAEAVTPTGGPRTPAILALEKSLRDAGYTGEMTPRVLEGWKQVMQEKGLDFGMEPTPGNKGTFLEGNETRRSRIDVDPNKASVTTAPHELAHNNWVEMGKERQAQYERAIKPDLDRINAERKVWNEANPDKQMRLIDAEEFFASEMGVKAAERAAKGENVGLRNWWEDTKAAQRAKKEGASLEDIYRTEATRLMNRQKADVSKLPQTGFEKAPVTAPKTQPEGEDIGMGSELDYITPENVESADAIRRTRILEQSKAKQAEYKAANEEIQGEAGPRSAGVKPNTYPVDAQYDPTVPKAPERRHFLGEDPTPGEIEVIQKSLDDAFKSHIQRIRRLSDLTRLSPEVVDDIKGRAILKLQEEGIDSDGLRNTVFRRMNEALNDEFAEYKRTKAVSLETEVGDDGATLGDFVAKQDETVREEVMQREEAPLSKEKYTSRPKKKPGVIKSLVPKEEVIPVEKIESPTAVTEDVTEVKAPKKVASEPKDAPVKVKRAMSDVIARVEQVRKELLAEGEPVKNAKKIAAIDEVIEKMRSMPEGEALDVAKMLKGLKKQGQDEDISLPAGVPTNEGYRWVNLKKADGSTERVLYNDKQYKGFPGDPHSIARMVNGKMSHGMTTKGQTIEELGVKQQPEGEDILARNEKKMADVKDDVAKDYLTGEREYAAFVRDIHQMHLNTKPVKVLPPELLLRRFEQNHPQIEELLGVDSLRLAELKDMFSRISENIDTDFNKLEQLVPEDNRRNQGDAEDITITPDGSRRGFFRSWAATFDKLDKVNPKLAEAFRRWETQRDIYEGWGNAAAKDLQKFNRDEVNEVFAAHREAFRNETYIPEFTGNKAEISDILTDYFHDSIGQERNDLGIRINNREAGMNEAYVPDMLSRNAVDLLVNKPYLPEGRAAAREWAEYIVQQSDGKISMDEAREYVDHYTRAMGATSGNYLSVDFGPIRKAEGFGVPENLREKDALTALLRYSRRASRDLAMFKELEKPRDIAATLELNDRETGSTVREDGVEGLSKLTEVKDAMKWVTGEFGSAQQNLKTPKFTAITRLVNNLIMGPATAIRDTATVPVNMVPYLNNFSDLGAALRGIADFRKNARDSLEFGATKPNIDKVIAADIAESPDKFTDWTRKLASWARVIQGRETIENFNRDVTFSIGKELAKVHILGAKAGKASSERWLKKFDTLVDGDVTQLEGEALDKAVNVIAKNFTDRNQGTYGGRGLPVGIVDSQFAPFFSLQKWSLEKSNVIWKDVMKPFITGENRLPMLTYLFGSVMTGAAIQELNEVLTNKKSQDPKISEVLAKGSAEDYVAKLASLMQLGSYAGIMSDLAKGAVDAGVYGKTPRNIASFPTATMALDTAERIAFVAEAIQQGENPLDTTFNFAVDTFTQNVQMARMIANRTNKADDVERSGKFRDLRVYDQLEGGKQQRFPRINPYVGTTEREFKRTSDLGEAKELAKEIKQDIRSTARNRFEREAMQQSAKTMSYRTMPSKERNPREYRAYYKYLVETQGKEEADAIVQDYRQQRRLNKRKARMIN